MKSLVRTQQDERELHFLPQAPKCINFHAKSIQRKDKRKQILLHYVPNIFDNVAFTFILAIYFFVLVKKKRVHHYLIAGEVKNVLYT